MGDRVVCLFIGLWWLFFQMIPYKHLKERPGKEFPSDWKGVKGIFFGWHRIVNLFCEARKYPQTFLYLICFFFFSDGVASIGSMGILVGQNVLCMGTLELLIVLFLNVSCSYLG